MALEKCNDQTSVTADKVKAVTFSTALALWSDWPLDIPPTGATGEAACDKRLAAAFRTLAAMPDLEQRLRWIEAGLFSTNDFPPPNAPVDRYRAALTQWWLDLFESQQSGVLPV